MGLFSLFLANRLEGDRPFYIGRVWFPVAAREETIDVSWRKSLLRNDSRCASLDLAKVLLAKTA